ncbi:MAG: helix-turn-helix domain-containing protein [Myxococcota bacterium]
MHFNSEEEKLAYAWDLAERAQAQLRSRALRAKRVLEICQEGLLDEQGRLPRPKRRRPVVSRPVRRKDPDALLSISEVAELLSVSTRQVSRLLNEQAFSFVRVGRHRKIRRAELERYVASRELAR